MSFCIFFIINERMFPKFHMADNWTWDLLESCMQSCNHQLKSKVCFDLSVMQVGSSPDHFF